MTLLSLSGSGVWFDADAQPAAPQLVAEVLGAFPRRSGDHAGASRVDLPGVGVSLGTRHARNDLTQRVLDVVEGVALTVEHHHLVRPKLPHAAQCVWVDADVGCGWCGGHVDQYGSPRRLKCGSPEWYHRRVGEFLRSTRQEELLQRVAQQVDAEHRDQDRQPRKDRVPPGDAKDLSAFG